METPMRQPSFVRKKMTKQLTGKRDDTALHSAARSGNAGVVSEIFSSAAPHDGGNFEELLSRQNQAGETPLYVAAEYGYGDVVREMLKYSDILTAGIKARNGYDAFHIAAKQGDLVRKLLEFEGIDIKLVNRSQETALDTAEKTGNLEITSILREAGVESTRGANQPSKERELKQTVSDIKHEVHSQLEQTRQTRKRVQGIAKRINKLHEEGLNNAINSTTVVAVLIATVAFAAIFTVPGQYVTDPNDISPTVSMGEAYIAHMTPFHIFFIFDSIALFISLAVVVVQASVVVIESRAKKQLMTVINKLMWLACVLISVAFIALSYIVVGKHLRWLAIAVTLIGTLIMATTLGTMCYWVIMHRIEASNMRSIRRSFNSRSRSGSMSAIFSDPEVLNTDYKKMYAI
ncbi:hypothetical protein AMTRI_Chr08g164030 [Amborella trichopoda]